MELINLAILTKDVEFGSALARSIVRNTKGMEVWVYNDSARMLREKDAIPIDLIAVEEAFIEEAFDKESPEFAPDLTLVEKASEEKDYRIYKYGSVKGLIDSLYLKYTQKTGREIISDASHNCEVYTFVSERGGSGCTGAAMSLAKEFSVYREKRTLFVSLSQFPGTQEADREGKKKNLKQFLYQLICRHNEGEYSAIDSYTVKDENEVCHFIYPNSQNPILELYEDGFLKFLKTIFSLGTFDAVIIDAGDQIGMPMIRSMQNSDLVYFVTDDREENRPWRRCMEGVIDGKTVSSIVPVRRKCGKITA